MKKAEDELWQRGMAATPVAVAIDTLVRPTSNAIAPIINDLENRHGLSVQASYTGVRIQKNGETVYEQGSYAPVQAVGREQCSQYRRNIYLMLRWCCTHYPTDLLNQHKAWIYGN